MRKLSIRARHWCTCRAYTSGTDAYAQHAHQFSHFSNAYAQHKRKNYKGDGTSLHGGGLYFISHQNRSKLGTHLLIGPYHSSV